MKKKALQIPTQSKVNKSLDLVQNICSQFSDRVKLYNHKLLDPRSGPEALQRKVQFDLRFYFCRRGMENIDTMKKDAFQFKYNSESKEWFVIKVQDELTKNHREMEPIISGIMPENKTDDKCPVLSFKTYIEHLNPENPFMWQQPLQKLDPEKPDIWFSKKNWQESSCCFHVRIE